MFRMAGAHVAICDWKPSEIDYVPHFQGDCKYIQDLGWDLVIAHPPCTYLSAVGSKWLSVEPDREQAVRSSARLFLSILDAKAPFVVVENPRIHPLAQLLVGGRTPTQIVQLYEHGTDHCTATGLFLTPNLPHLTPTCLVDDRVSAMADLSRSPKRGSLRSRTYVGIAAAMALQWLPVVLEYCRTSGTYHSLLVKEMLEKAREDAVADPLPDLPLSAVQSAEAAAEGPRTAPS
jgi:hypothetical protein